jgi:hypothetical protein
MSSEVEVLRQQIIERDSTINSLKEKTKAFVSKLKDEHAVEKASLEDQIKSQQVYMTSDDFSM